MGLVFAIRTQCFMKWELNFQVSFIRISTFGVLIFVKLKSQMMPELYKHLSHNLMSLIILHYSLWKYKSVLLCIRLSFHIFAAILILYRFHKSVTNMVHCIRKFTTDNVVWASFHIRHEGNKRIILSLLSAPRSLHLELGWSHFFHHYQQ
jgi:hypothetical protein